MRMWIVWICAAASLIGVSFAYADTLNVPGIGSSIILTTTPQYPAPGQQVQIQALSPLINLSQSQITWLQDGRRIAQGIGMVSTSITVGALGETTDVIADITTAEGLHMKSETRLTSSQIDLLYDGDTYIPPLYRGRSLPSAGTVLELHALPWFKTKKGTWVTPSNIIFTWRQGGAIFASASGLGKNTARIPLAPFVSATTITVDAVSVDNTFSGQARIQIPIVEPLLDLYQDHPLFGIMSHQALSDGSAIRDTRASFQIIPYFAPTHSTHDPRMSYEWTVDGTPVSASSSADEITVEPAAHTATIAVSLSHTDNIYFGLSAAWRIGFVGATTIQKGLFAPTP